MPTERFSKVRRLLKEGKAKVVRREPFTIKLLYEPETDVVQECYCGVDTGSKHIGVAVVGNDKVLYQSQTELRSDIKKKMDARRASRYNRRYRKTRYRKCRFLNRRNSIRKDRLLPSVNHKVQAHIDEIEFCKKILPVLDENIILEVSQFDIALMKNPSLINEKVKHWGATRKVSTMATLQDEKQSFIGITTPASVVVRRTVDWKFTTLNSEAMVEQMMKRILLLYVKNVMMEFMLVL